MVAEVKCVFATYPKEIQEKLLHVRELLYKTAKEIENISIITESLKWNEPSYSTKEGSPIRLGYKKAKPENYSIYFNCNTKLVVTFRKLFSDRFTFVGNREMVFHKNDLVDEEALKYCITLALTYKLRKHLPMLDS